MEGLCNKLWQSLALISVLVLGNAGILPNVNVFSVGYFCVVLCHISTSCSSSRYPFVLAKRSCSGLSVSVSFCCKTKHKNLSNTQYVYLPPHAGGRQGSSSVLGSWLEGQWTPEYVLLTAATDINRLTHPPVAQAFVHAATDTPLGKASHTAEPRSQSGEVLCGESTAAPWGAQPRPCSATVSSMPAPFWPRAGLLRRPSSHLRVFTCSSSPQNSLPLVYSGSN